MRRPTHPASRPRPRRTPRTRPDASATSASSRAPTWETTPRPSADTTTLGNDPVTCTLEVPSCATDLNLEQAQNRLPARHFVTSTARVAPQDQLLNEGSGLAGCPVPGPLPCRSPRRITGHCHLPGSVGMFDGGRSRDAPHRDHAGHAGHPPSTGTACAKLCPFIFPPKVDNYRCTAIETSMNDLPT